MKVCIHMMQLRKPAVTDVKIEYVRLESVVEIRHQVLRSGQPRERCYYPEDAYKNTAHVAIKLNNEIVGCASVYKESHPDFALRQSWRIRGMAVLPVFQGRGFGSQLLQACINHAIKYKADVIWCNARVNAIDFYQRGGFKIIGDEFELPDIGPHYLLAKNLGIYHSPFKFLQIARKILGRKPAIVAPQSRQKS